MKNLKAKRMPLILLALVLGIAGCENAASPDGGGANEAAVGFTTTLASLLDNTISADPYTNVNNEVAFRKGHGEIIKDGATTTTITIPPGVTLNLSSDHWLELKKSPNKPTTKAEFIFTGGGTLRLDGVNSLKTDNANLTFDGITLAVTTDNTIDGGNSAAKVIGKGTLGYKVEGTVTNFLAKGTAGTGALLTGEAAGTTVDLTVVGTFMPNTTALRNIRNITFDSVRPDATLNIASAGTLISLANASNITGNGKILFTNQKGIDAKGALKIASGITLGYGSAGTTWDATALPAFITGKNISMEDGVTIDVLGGELTIDTIKDLIYDGTAKRLKGNAIGLTLKTGSITLGRTSKEAEDYSGLKFQDIELKEESGFVLNYGFDINVKGDAIVGDSGNGFSANVGAIASRSSTNSSIAKITFLKGAALKGIQVTNAVSGTDAPYEGYPTPGQSKGIIDVWASANFPVKSIWKLSGFDEVFNITDDNYHTNINDKTGLGSTPVKGRLVAKSNAAILSIDKGTYDALLTLDGTYGSSTGIAGSYTAGDPSQVLFVVE